MVYHFKITCVNPEKPRRSDIEPIMFFNRMLNDAEIKYWPTELEMPDLIWVVRKVRHIIKATKAEKTTVIFIDHAVNISIAGQTTLASNNIDKFNLRLVRAFIYLSQFRLNVKYRLGNKHIIPDALSRLFSGNGPLPRRSPADSLNLDIYFSGLMDPSNTPHSYVFQGFFIKNVG